MHGNRKKLAAFILLIVSIALFDQVSKIWIMSIHDRSPEALYRGIPVIKGLLEITLTHNTGIIFGFLGNANNMVILIINSVILVSVMFFLFRDILARPERLAYFIGFSMIIGGALGNIIDRIVVGRVIDFIKLYITRDFVWPIFNIADSAITVGIVLVFIDLIFLDSSRRKNAPDTC